MSLIERRARFVYEAARLAAIAAGAPIVPVPWDEREEPFREQFCEVIERQCGPNRSMSPADLHADWVRAYLDMGWVYGETYDPHAKTHPDMVPYADLGQLERDKDAVFVALCEIARQWVYDSPLSRRGDTMTEKGSVVEALRDIADHDPVGDEFTMTDAAAIAHAAIPRAEAMEREKERLREALGMFVKAIEFAAKRTGNDGVTFRRNSMAYEVGISALHSLEEETP